MVPKTTDPTVPADEDPAERAAADYAARLAAGEAATREEYLETLDASYHERFLELAEQAELAHQAMGAGPPPVGGDAPERILSGRYRLGHEIGAGGMGRVFLARDLTRDGRKDLGRGFDRFDLAKSTAGLNLRTNRW